MNEYSTKEKTLRISEYIRDTYWDSNLDELLNKIEDTLTFKELVSHVS